ncbi:aldehyde dehydrogenase family protein [Hoeflea sp. G2-23]|uniref:Aldehyde dehydrogenase family protein n=1 Tax=Hoeflea algicola TaxID=2983763 RepID=A0ABT3ZBM0_9HYPH|nr:aldehyde dehydrogenase family protein [Hoeflea algicola]MCY0149186.1 aldehyde dehydrogenase family protein [Hoeflea algicola]
MNQIRDILDTMDYGPAPEDDKDVRAWLTSHKAGFGHFIGGEFTKPGGKTFEVHNPANTAKLADVAIADAGDVDKAVAAANRALKKWQALSGNQRARHLYALARHVQKHARFLAVLETLDNGKTIRETRDIDIPLVARHFYHHAGWAELSDTVFPGYEAAGVCGQIIPWNFPLLMLSWKVAPALAAGCTVVLKSAEHTPLSAIAFAEICAEAGLPAGVFNLVNGAGGTGAALAGHEGIAKLAFTGSTEVGRLLRRQTAGSGKKLSLELGGKSPFIVFDNADIDAAVEGVVDAIWFNQGEVCCAGSRAIVQEGIADRFHDKLRARMEKLRVGDPLDKSMDMGAVVAPVQIREITAKVEAGLAEGATMWQPSWAKTISNADGCFFPPTLFTDVAPSSTLAQEEVFGPVLASMTFRTPGEAVQLANNSRYGLAASVWSQNLDEAFDAARTLKSGIVWINSTNLFDASAGFGGYKESGFGREGGREGMLEYLFPSWQKKAKSLPASDSLPAPTPAPDGSGAGLDRTVKMYVGGKQARPDSGYSYPVSGKNGQHLAEVGLGNRKDIRNAVDAAHKASGWSGMTGHARAQVLYFLAENLELRAAEFAARLTETGASSAAAKREVEASVARIMHYAAWADKYDGAVRAPDKRMLTLALNEPWDVMGISCPDEAPLLGFVSLVMPAIAMGNRVVVTPSPRQPLSACDFYQVLDTSDVPGGVVNIITGDRDTLADTMAKHDDIAALWYFGSHEGTELVERESAGNLKAVWANNGKARDWFDATQGQGEEFLFRAVRIKTIWTPFGV